MNMELITSAASDALVNVVLAIIALAGAYGVYYIRLGAAKLKEQTDRKSTRLNSSHNRESRMPSSA